MTSNAENLKKKKTQSSTKVLGKIGFCRPFLIKTCPSPILPHPTNDCGRGYSKFFFFSFKLMYGGGRDNWTIELFYEGIHNFR